MLEWLKSAWASWRVRVAMVGGVVVVATAYGSCSFDPQQVSDATNVTTETTPTTVPVSTDTTTTTGTTTTTTETDTTTTTTNVENGTNTTETTDTTTEQYNPAGRPEIVCRF